jgi:single-strand DNA-binding protein
MNTANIIARLAADPELRHTPNGTKVARLRVAIPRRKSKDGEDRGAVFLDVQAWGKQAELAAEHLKTGRQIAVTGRLEQDEWTDDDGNRRQKVFVVAEQIDWLAQPRQDAGTDGADDAPATTAAGQDLDW